jgi:hypothetical protein
MRKGIILPMLLFLTKSKADFSRMASLFGRRVGYPRFPSIPRLCHFFSAQLTISSSVPAIPSRPSE